VRNETPSARWLKAFDAAFVAAGGHAGRETLAAVRAAHAVPLYQRGATPAAAGKAADAAAQLHSKLSLAEEAAGWR
jgi:hypothetical protein